MRDNGSVLGGIARGAVAGAVATWIMSQATTFLYERESEQARQQEDEARGDKTAYATAAEKGADLAGVELSEKRKKYVGSALHWALGIAAGATYGAMRGRLLGTDWKAGLEFGSAFFLLVDELANPVLGLTPGPQAFPWQTHVRGLAGHSVFGIAAEASMRVLERVT